MVRQSQVGSVAEFQPFGRDSDAPLMDGGDFV
jgi:hypothetical protein